MPLPIYLSMAIIVILYLFFMEKPLNFLQNATIYMVIVFLATLFITIVRMELHLMEKSSGHLDYISFLLYRNLLLPVVVMIFINHYLQRISGENKVFLFFFILFILVGLDWLNDYLRIIIFTRWNLFYSGIVNALYLLIALGVLKMLLNINVQESNKDENL
ncbi:hypothetical protein J7E38_07765 [Bacillus sp. ISL-35]|uniref:hypothetical protein n=1 Tax=Bacillus sp. ISL-35 TaxID=2819122 RepID=UPI001BEBEB33|nr:hypothetical protein [Bacillus sp. ISL-35]MBT2678897.1 hypothetical protein [Bacillus sp. ISL-35]MBT2703893.1 hypothetical protein [Chryseobacterium sp. ISL-80]